MSNDSDSKKTAPFSRGGRCLCGEVRFTASALTGEVGLCHCGMCRRWSGGLAWTGMHAKLTLEKSEALAWWSSSPWGERGFCARCGTPLFWRTKDAPQEVVVSVGAVDFEDAQDALTIVQHIFYDDKPGFYETTDSAVRMNGVAFTASVLKGLGDKHGKEALAAAVAQFRAHAGEQFTSEVEKLL